MVSPMAARQMRSVIGRAPMPAMAASSVRGFCSPPESPGSIKVNNIPVWAPQHNTDKFPLPYRDCTILTVLDSASMSGRADCRQGICRKCAVNVKVEENGDTYEVLSCQEIAVDGQIITIPDGWQAKPRWADPHPEKLRVTTRELKATGTIRNSATLGKRLKKIVASGNFAFKKQKWAEASKQMDAIDEAIEKFGFDNYLDFQKCSTLNRDLVPDFLVALHLAPKTTMFEGVPADLAEKAGELAGHVKEHLEEAGTSAAAYDADMDEMTVGSHGLGKKGTLTEGADGGAGALASGAFYRNFSVWPQLRDIGYIDVKGFAKPQFDDVSSQPNPGECQALK